MGRLVRPRLLRGSRDTAPCPLRIPARQGEALEPKRRARRGPEAADAHAQRSPLGAGHPRFSFGPSGYAGLIIPASRLPSTLPCLLADPRPLTGTALAGNAIA